MTALLDLAAVEKRYATGRTEVHALRGVDLVIEHGEFVAVMGPSGSGKTTLMEILGCLSRPSAGCYRFDGRDVAAIDADGLSQLRGEAIGFVFQSFNLLPRLTAAENVELPLVYRGVARDERRARALVNRPALILADEPTGNLDSATGAEIMAMLHALNAEGHTLVLVTHDAGVGDEARRRVRIRDGRIQADERSA